MEKTLVKVDTVSGSRAYNRLDMQVSQTLHMAIELYDELNYLLVLDHYDDITLFDLEAEPLVVSYYQMKTSDEMITIDSAIRDDWLAKLHAQLSRPEDWIVKELGLITNTPLEVKYNLISEKGKKIPREARLVSKRTPFIKLPQSVQDKIRSDIADKLHISENQVDLSKFAHLHTTLTNERHKDIVEKEMGDFLHEKYPRIKVDTVKAIYGTLIDLLTKRQEYERLPADAEFDEVKRYKGFTRTELSRVIDETILMSLPVFDDVMKYSGAGEEIKLRLSLPYVQILTDSNNRDDESFRKLFQIIKDVIEHTPYDASISLWEYGQHIGAMIQEKEPTLGILYNEDYIAVLVICIKINESRRTQ